MCLGQKLTRPSLPVTHCAQHPAVPKLRTLLELDLRVTNKITTTSHLLLLVFSRELLASTFYGKLTKSISQQGDTLNPKIAHSLTIGWERRFHNKTFTHFVHTMWCPYWPKHSAWTPVIFKALLTIHLDVTTHDSYRCLCTNNLSHFTSHLINSLKLELPFAPNYQNHVFNTKLNISNHVGFTNP